VHDSLSETTILVDILRDHTQAITWVNSLPPQERWVSVVTYFELLAGCRNHREQRIVAREMRKAVTLREALHQARPDNVDIKVGYASSLCAVGQFAEARRLVDEVLVLMPGYPYANQL
jgi:hypothetical protein